MKEQDLINLGFKKVDADADGVPFYYYEYEFGDTCLISSANDESENDKWSVESDNYLQIKFKKLNDLKIYISLLQSIFRYYL
jgi:hypothetical protein